MRNILAAASFAMLAACATDATPGSGAASTSLAAPTPADVATKIAAASDGQTVMVKVGTKIAVELVGVPTAGYLWKIVDKPGFLEAAGEYGGPTSSSQLEEGFAGGNHWEAFAFNVTGIGEGELRFEQGRAWEEPSSGDGAAFSVLIVAEE
ncbi:MAG: protease inhibitor I42 family protein [Parvularculaceae bacterium]